ncbi:2-keto-3-deoxy-L-rhamnonate aldolase RhmA [Rhodovulum sulfidophilum]|uniref:HpcH/HpaI aldolase family protein n=1 Tax=Rhodovulum sulfidophilum TaxID=35806 RepID=UPI001E38B807|nr:aldolase/citrate lyase family protein [Rhodovulum sulfidophilum]MCW2304336.1 2-keto-3-deoxy-L-rhamnonate aldolase RhmA [Rhodovulum sulfidophilum]
MQSKNAASPEIGLAFCLAGRAEAVLLAKGAGFDFAVMDMEHGPIGLSELGQAAAVGQAAGFPVHARVTGPGSPDLARALDCGAAGVIVPHVDSADEARRVVRACRFAPVGRRALPGPLPVADYVPLPADALVGAAGGGKVMAMIESAEALAAVEEIAAVPGLDALIVGTNDLADGMGLRGRVGHPEIQAAFGRIAAAARARGLAFGAMGLPPELVESHALALGASILVATNETNLIVEGGAALLAALRGPAGS